MKTISPPEKDAPTAEPSEARSGALPKRDARRQTTRKTLLAALAGLFVLQGVMHAQTILPQWQKNYSTGKGAGIEANLGADQVILQMFGFREFLAGILWVKADGFFDNGNYDAILPIIRLCTALDPKQIDIYATGMWHIGYNFTDEDQRSDRRYIPSALALGKEGAKQNPNTYEMFFETGWMWYHKIDDDPAQPVEWFEKAHKRPDILPARKNLWRWRTSGTARWTKRSVCTTGSTTRR